MKKNKKMIENASWLIGCKLIKAVLVMLVTMITARYLGASNYGKINYAASLVAFFSPVMKLGFDATLVYELMNEPEKEGEIFGTSLVMNLMSSILCILGIISFSIIANKGNSELILVCSLYSFVLLFEAFQMIQYWFQAKLLAKYTAMAMLGSYVCITAFQFILVLLKKSVFWFAISYSLDFCLISIILLIKYKTLGRGKLKFSWERGKRMFNNSKFYIISGLMVTIFANTDRIMLTLMLNEASTGFYSAAVRCATMTSFVFAAIMDSARPVIFEAQKESDELFEKNLMGLYSVIIYFSLIQCILVTIFAPIIVKIMYGNGFMKSIQILQLVVWFTTFSYLGTVRDIWMLARNKQYYVWIINLCGAIVNIIGNFILIPSLGIKGAALASVFTQLFTNFILGFIIRDIYPNNKIIIKACNPKIMKETIVKMDILNKIKNKMKKNTV